MGIHKKYILAVAISCCFLSSYGQQTMQFSQYVFNGLAVNPAYAGYKEDWTISLSSRLQWVGIDGSPKTNTLSVDGLTNVDNKNVGVGLLATNDRLGPQNNSSVYANYAYRLRLDEDDTQRLSFGIGAGLIQYNIDGSKFNASNVSDAAIPLGNESKLTPDFRFGIYYYSAKVYVGASMLNLLPTIGANSNSLVINQVRHVYLTGGMLVPLSETVDIKPSVMFKEDFRGPTNVDVSGYVAFKKMFWLGASYRTAIPLWNKPNLQSNLDKNDAIAAILQLYLSERIRFGYSYDFTTSKLAGYQGGSHEISLSISFRNNKERVICPHFF